MAGVVLVADPPVANDKFMRFMSKIASLSCLIGLILIGAPTSAAAGRVVFGLCHTGGGTNCVVDGDTIWYQGERIRIADIDTPETHPARCPEEARLGKAATLRLQALLNQGPFELRSIRRDTDRYGRKLRIVERQGMSLGMILVREGLARPYTGGKRQPWCS